MLEGSSSVSKSPDIYGFAGVRTTMSVAPSTLLAADGPADARQLGFGRFGGASIFLKKNVQEALERHGLGVSMMRADAFKSCQPDEVFNLVK